MLSKFQINDMNVFESLIYLMVLCTTINGSSNEDEQDEFLATKEWQVIKEGQKVPKGLHYRINFETGVKEAKLLDDEDEQSRKERKNELLEIPNDEENHALLDTEIIKQAIKKIKDDDVKKAEKNTEKFRSFEELKKDFGDLNMIPKMDVEILIDLMRQHKDELAKDKIDAPAVVRILEDFDFLAHQIDNGVEFIKQDGLQEVIYKNINSTINEVKEATLNLFGSLLQNNPKVQISALESGAVTILLRTLSTEKSSQVQTKAFHALSCLLRRFPLAQLRFVKNGGLAVISKLFENSSLKLQVKLVTLMNDLIIENMQAARYKQNSALKQYEAVDLQSKLLNEQNWCENLNQLLIRLFSADPEDHDLLEKCIIAMHTTSEECSSVYNTNLLIQMMQRYKALEENEKAENESSDGYFNSLHNLILEILNVKHVKTEL
ncbi:unnamed protein product [Acanthoscelides obtectus]|uniref:Nucleotide exchange factor SIL1 n=1 Tax=Acanthoscelides obtectus TaxID=200917 RepID=A0A9P0P327_ACAOB|nr:unnamed protein product [Acanthoscelides obtectus]CAK1669948.1 Nucleotide exchange factor SIL1 [Acanthoscelides obtectus]